MAIVRSETIAFRLLNNALRSKKIAQIYLFYGGDTETRKDTALAFLAGVIGGRDALPEETIRSISVCAAAPARISII